MQFQMALWGIPISAVLLLVGAQTDITFLAPSIPDWLTLTWLIGVGAFAALSGILAVYAYRAAPASVIAPLQYFEIVSAAIVAYFVFGDFPDALKWLGIVIIIASGMFIILKGGERTAPAPDTTI